MFGLRANQSLKLTEPAVDEINARGATNTMSLSINFRAMNYKQNASRCRSLAIPLGGKKNLGSQREK